MWSHMRISFGKTTSPNHTFQLAHRFWNTRYSNVMCAMPAKQNLLFFPTNHYNFLSAPGNIMINNILFETPMISWQTCHAHKTTSIDRLNVSWDQPSFQDVEGKHREQKPRIWMIKHILFGTIIQNWHIDEPRFPNSSWKTNIPSSYPYVHDPTLLIMIRVTAMFLRWCYIACFHAIKFPRFLQRQRPVSRCIRCTSLPQHYSINILSLPSHQHCAIYLFWFQIRFPEQILATKQRLDTPFGKTTSPGHTSQLFACRQESDQGWQAGQVRKNTVQLVASQAIHVMERPEKKQFHFRFQAYAVRKDTRP